jgi:hypothetical protein
MIVNNRLPGERMTLDLSAADSTRSGLRPFPVAVTTIADGRTRATASGLRKKTGGS